MLHRRRARLASMVLIPASLIVLVGCADAGDSAEAHRAPVYAAVVRAIVAAVPDPEDKPTVVVAPTLDLEPIPIEVQADVLRLTDDVAVVRFVDGPDEALGDDGETVPDGVELVMVLGPLEGAGDVIEIDAETYRSSGDSTASRFRVTAVNGTWTAVEQTASASG